MRTVHVPEVHVCEGLSGRSFGRWFWPDGRVPLALSRARAGTVRECSCGRTWVAGEYPGMVAAIWRREGRLERWMRERRRAA